MTWIELIDDAIKIIVPGLIAYFVARHTASKLLETKTLEIKGESEFKAREHIFNIYQGKIQQIERDMADLLNLLGKMMGNYLNEQDRCKKDVQLYDIKSFISKQSDNFMQLIQDLKSELIISGIYDEHDVRFEKEISKISKLLSKDLEKLPSIGFKNYMDDYTGIIAFIKIMQTTLLEKKCHDLFAPFLDSENK